ncbi:hypothetical protein [Streptomyces caeruleatus]|uniref:Uncharacterized protein n=1 Tax=Streptomyces caeruleatus TaxID=661399 RepID=A0A101TV78_9ACTN|nr:hypothetical protein [Streptomyces caeruleatus]KUN99057.1 hypothetical protein AQJ67_25795 [Streptomyces caeruleatus]
MRQCTATAEVLLTDILIAILAGQGQISSQDCEDIPDTARCQLGLWHGDEHADFVWEWEHKPHEGLWARWTPDGVMRFESLAHCEITDGSDDGDACWLYRDHAREHSWALRDPAMEAFRRQVLAENAGLLAWLTRQRE